MPELDSHTPGPNNPTPLQTRFSPWHACGTQVDSYMPSMRQSGHLNLEGCTLRLQPGDAGHEAASRQWEEMFGVGRSRDMLAFTNARLGFLSGQEGQPEGLVSVTIGVRGREKLDAILERARNVGICRNNWVSMCGVNWYFVLTGHDEPKGKL